jgi:hypothetical protein
MEKMSGVVLFTVSPSQTAEGPTVSRTAATWVIWNCDLRLTFVSLKNIIFHIM